MFLTTRDHAVPIGQILCELASCVFGRVAVENKAVRDRDRGVSVGSCRLVIRTREKSRNAKGSVGIMRVAKVFVTVTTNCRQNIWGVVVVVVVVYCTLL